MRNQMTIYIEDLQNLDQLLVLANRVGFSGARLLVKKDRLHKVLEGLGQVSEYSRVWPIRLTDYVLLRGGNGDGLCQIMLQTDSHMTLPELSVLRCVAGSVAGMLEKEKGPSQKIQGLYSWAWGREDMPNPFTREQLAGILSTGEGAAAVTTMILPLLGIPAAVIRGRKQVNGCWQEDCWNMVQLRGVWTPLDLLDTGFSGLGGPGDYGTAFRKTHRWEDSQAMQAHLEHCAALCRAMQREPLRGCSSFRAALLGGMTLELPAQLVQEEPRGEMWNLLWLTCLLGGGFLPAGRDGKPFWTLLGHRVSLPEEKAGVLAREGYFPREYLGQLPLRLTRELCVTSIQAADNAPGTNKEGSEGL